MIIIICAISLSLEKYDLLSYRELCDGDLVKINFYNTTTDHIDSAHVKDSMFYKLYFNISLVVLYCFTLTSGGQD